MLLDSPQHSKHMHAQSIQHREQSWIQDTESSFQLLKKKFVAILEMQVLSIERLLEFFLHFLFS
jgi:hypothetical protein